MKNVNFLVSFFALGIISFGTNAADKYVDPIQKKIDEQHKPLIEKFKKSCQSKNTIGCQIEAANRADEAIPNRGTPRYCKQAYAGYSNTQSKQKLSELVKLYDSLEGQSTATRWPGKITQANVDFEASCLLEKLGERRDGIVGAKLYLGLSPR
ncbi:TPA: hypothetical protein G8V45_004468 [Salmonella enterica]|uniref:Secreted protein n=1 Tax=Salmonella enterica TaxID=28901 RepID=A0A758FUJ4_SALER|nr:hypothetical protein [Salmonella enterica]